MFRSTCNTARMIRGLGAAVVALLVTSAAGVAAASNPTTDECGRPTVTLYPYPVQTKGGGQRAMLIEGNQQAIYAERPSRAGRMLAGLSEGDAFSGRGGKGIFTVVDTGDGSKTDPNSSQVAIDVKLLSGEHRFFVAERTNYAPYLPGECS